ncbi:MAG TPA: DSD1 family PLP-dependent enzyme [Burkholderiaceae bacterium]|nr:DSD1 family PLP-dependent enzyme [Burkholderiaceae bacterium]
MRSNWLPAAPGDKLQEIDTPALVLDLDRFEANLARLQEAAVSFKVRVRPHAKTHKCVEIARRQMAAGAVGICVQKLGEAEVFLARDFTDVLITNEVVGERKLRRLAQLAWRFPHAKLGACVDDVAVARRLGTICDEQDARLQVYVELDVGQNRCGVASPDEVVELARAIVAAPRLTFMGLHAYAGSAQHRRGVPERRAAVEAAVRKVTDARTALRAADLPCEIITGGGTGTFIYEAASNVYNEIQPGSYVMMDADYARNEYDASAPRFDHALFVLASVMSLRGERATLDAGLKTFSMESGAPVPTFKGWQVWSVSDEHTVLHRTDDGANIKLGDRALLIPGHCDPTVNLHDYIIAVRKGRVEALWPIDARGCVF